MLPNLKLIPPHYFEEYTRNFQIPMGPTLSKGTLEEVYLVVMIYIPCIINFFFYLTPIVSALRKVPILALTNTLPSVIRYHPSRFLEAIERCASLCSLPFPVAVLIQTQSLPKTSHRTDNLPSHRIRTAPSVCGCERLDLSLRLFCRRNDNKISVGYR